MKSSLRNVGNELKGGIKTIDLASKSVTCLEKLLWFVVGISGIIWAAWFVPNQFQIWMNNPTTIMKEEMRLDDVDYPAVTWFSLRCIRPLALRAKRPHSFLE